jgi:hypothetical protein
VSTLYGTKFFVDRSPLVQLSADAVVPVIREVCQPTSVIDFGCGQGEWLAAFEMEDVLGVDIAVHDSTIQHDLTRPLRLKGRFDLALCLEVGEHLPESAADTLVDTIAFHADTVVFSAAVPGQEGTGHINCQPHEYWHEKFEARGYQTIDVIRPLIRHDDRVRPWYKDNIFLHARAG